MIYLGFAIICLELFICVLGMLFSYKEKKPTFFIWICSTFFYVVYGFYDLYQVDFFYHELIDVLRAEGHNTYVVIYAHTFSLLFFIVFYLIDRFYWGNKEDKYSFKKVFDNFNSKINYSSPVLFIFCISVALIFYEGYRNWGMNLFQEANFGSIRAKYNLVIKVASAYLFFGTVGLSFVLLINKKFLLLAFVAVLVIVEFILAGGGRQVLLLFFVSFLLYGIYKYKIPLIVLVFFFFIGYNANNLLLSFRHAGGVGGLTQDRELEEVSGEASIRIVYYTFFKKGFEIEDGGTGQTFLRLFMFWLPSSVSNGLKPVDFEMKIGNAVAGVYSNAKNELTLHPTIMGIAYSNFFWLGIFSPILILWIIYFMYNISRFLPELYQPIYLTCYFGMTFMMYRGAFYGAFMNILFCFLLLKGLSYVDQKSKNTSSI